MPKLPVLAFSPTRRRWTTGDARKVLTALEASGLSVNAFATREGLDVQRLYFWKRRLAGETTAAATPTFIEVVPRGGAHVEVVLRSRRILRIPAAIDMGTLRRLVHALEDVADC